MKFTVITAVLNRAGTIEQAVRSVQRQGWRDIEHVVQDGGSTDGTLDILHRTADARTRIVSERDGGIYDALNRALARATGDAVGLMHSDDVFAHADVLAHVAAAMADPSVDGVYGDLDYVSAADPARILRRWVSGQYDRRKLARGWMPPHPALFLRRAVLDRHGGYDTSFRIAADYEAMLRYLVQGGIRLAYLPEVMVRMRMGGASNGSAGGILRKSREDLRAMRRHGVGGIGTLAAKNLGKLPQFLPRPALPALPPACSTERPLPR